MIRQFDLALLGTKISNLHKLYNLDELIKDAYVVSNNSLRKLKLIGIVGKAHSGKTTTARLLQTYINTRQNADVVNYAYTCEMSMDVKLVCSALFGLDDMFFINSELKEGIVQHLGVSPRQLMQYTGDLFRVLFGEDFWLKRLMYDLVDNMRDRGEIHIISGLRYQNEIDFIIRHSGIVIHLTHNQGCGTIGFPGATSEQSLDFSSSPYKKGVNYYEVNREEYGTLQRLGVLLKQIASTL